MEHTSPSSIIKFLDSEIRRCLRQVDIRKLPARQRQAVEELLQDLGNASTYSRSYESSETREEQLKHGRVARKWLARARKQLLVASEYNLFDAIDTAHLTARMDKTIEDIK